MADDDREQAQLRAEREHIIGGTDIPAILGLSTFGRTALDVWLRLRGMAIAGEGSDEEMEDRFELGRLMEEPIAQRYQRRTGVALRKPPAVIIHPKYPWAGGHIDREATDASRDVECKTVEWNVDEWSDPNKGEPIRVPEDYALQVIWYLWLRLWERRHDIAAQVSFRPLRIYPFSPDDPNVRSIATAVFEKVQAFYERYVLGGEPPPLDAGQTARRWLLSRFPRPTTELIVAPAEAEEIARAAHEAEEKAQEWARKEEAFKNQLRSMIGDAYGMRGQGWKATWPAVGPLTKALTDWPAILASLGVEVPDELKAKYTKTVTVREGYRRLNLTFKDKEK